MRPDGNQHINRRLRFFLQPMDGISSNDQSTGLNLDIKTGSERVKAS